MSNGLGRGLSSLIPKKVNKITTSSDGEAVVNTSTAADKGKMLMLNPDKINFNPLQPRKSFSNSELDELVESIKQYGIIQPLIVSHPLTPQQGSGQASSPRPDFGELSRTELGTKAGQEVGDRLYELIAGERRLRAAKIVGLKEVPVIVRDVGEQEKLEVSLIENLQREDLNPIETGLAYRKLIDEFNLTQEEVAKKVAKARPSVTNALRFLNLPEEIQAALMEKKISEGHAKYLVGLDSLEKQMIIFKKILRSKLSVYDTIQEVRRLGGTKKARVKINYADKDKEFAFREFFSTKVEIKRKGKGGQIVIDFFSDEELGEMVGKVKSEP